MVACGSRRARRAAVAIKMLRLRPRGADGHAGTTVTWINQDDIPHTVVADDKSFNPRCWTATRLSFTFTKPGEYGYFCSLHPHMVGKVIVKG